MRQLDLLVVPSLWEAGPLLPMEAMSAGCACVASRVGGVEVLIEHEQNGLLVPPGDVDALTAALERLSADPARRRRLGAAARATIEERFHWARIAESYERLFAAVLSGAPAAVPAPYKR